MRVVGTFALALFAACASSNAIPSTVRANESINVSNSTGGVSSTRIAPSVTTSVVTMNVSLDRVWQALPAVYDSLGIPIAELDARQHIIGNHGFSVRRRLGKTALSRYIDCGSSQIGPNADDYQITMSVLTAARGQGDTTVVTTNVDATGTGLQFSGQSVRCTSRGELEQRIHALTRELLR
jgi:hypothetical protein